MPYQQRPNRRKPSRSRYQRGAARSRRHNRLICAPSATRPPPLSAAPTRRSVYLAGRARSRLVIGPQHGSGVPCRWGEDALPHRVAGRGWREDRPHPDGGIGSNRPHLISLCAIAGVAEPVGAADAPPAAACHAAAACDMPPARATCSPPLINARNGGFRARQACGPAGLYPAIHAGSGRGCAGGILC